MVEERLAKPDASATDPNFVFYNADGSVCYRVLAVVENTANGQTITTTYLDPAGHAVGELKTVGTIDDDDANRDVQRQPRPRSGVRSRVPHA